MACLWPPSAGFSGDRAHASFLQRWCQVGRQVMGVQVLRVAWAGLKASACIPVCRESGTG